VPRAPVGPGEVRVQHRSCGLNFIDVYHRTGLYKLPLPFTPGQEAAGVVAELGPGDFFGEMALLEHQRRSATVTAISDLRVVVMHERDFRAMEDELPEVARMIRATMDERRRRNAGSTDPA